jgi:IS4 transposase
MVLDSVFERLVDKAPVTVMVRGTLENVLSAEALDRLFLSKANTGYSRKLLFSQMVDLMGMVVARVQPQIYAAFQDRQESLRAKVDSVYDKLQRIEPQVSAALVQHVAGRLSAVIDQMPGSQLPPIFDGYRTKILDGKHLDGTQRRLKELRKFTAVPLPGQLLVVLDAQRMLACDVVPCEDAHAQERALVETILPAVQPGEVWIEDRNFCTTRFLFGVADRGGCFVVRRHKSNLFIEHQAPWKARGYTETSTISEAPWRIHDGGDRKMTVRAVHIKLDKPTRFGEKEVVLLTNLPDDVTASQVADGYRRRWTIEAAFGEISATLHAEINTMGYPKAALFGFCVGLVSYNVLSAVKASLRSVHGAEKVQADVSSYFLANEVRRKWDGLDLALDEPYWVSRFASLTTSELAQWLTITAARVKLHFYPKSKRGPKKKTLRAVPFGRHRHVSTARILATSKAKTSIPQRE